MRKVCALLLATAMLTGPALSAATLAGVTLPDSVQAGGKTLVLNGLGLRSRMMFKVYVAGLYVEQKNADGAAIYNADAPKRIVLHFVRDVSNTQIKEAIVDGFDPAAKQALKAEIERFTSAFESFAVGDEMTITYLPGSGTQLNVKGQDKLTIPGFPFARALFAIWLGDNPPSSSLKNGLLGK